MPDVKRMIHDAYGIQVLRREGSGGDPVSGRLYAMAHAVWAGKVMAAVENQEAPCGAVLKICYAPAGTWTDADLKLVVEHLRSAVLRLQGDPVQYRTLVKLRRLAEVATLNLREECQGGGLPIMQICEMCGIDRSSWYKRQWQRWFDAMGGALDGWRVQGIRAVCTVCEEVELARAA